MKNIKLFYLYYNNPQAIEHLERVYRGSGIPVVIVDDGSTVPLRCDWATVYRIDEDVPWNMSRANNYGFGKLNVDDYILRCDIDHWFLPDDINKLVGVEGSIVKFNRVVYRSDGSSYNTPSPPNIYLAKVGDLVDAGGYDERFCGHYGYEDKEFMDRLARRGVRTVIHPFVVSRCNDWLGTKKLDRDGSVNRELYERIKLGKI
jgi:hypothetical protein